MHIAPHRHPNWTIDVWVIDGPLLGTVDQVQVTFLVWGGIEGIENTPT